MSTASVNQKGKLNRSGFNRIVQVLGFVLIYAALLFGGAGKLDWWQAWAFIAIYLGGILVNAIWAIGRDPELINERGKIGENAKSWDKVIGVIFTLLLLAIFLVAGLDDRFGWSMVPLGLNLVGAVGVILTMGLIYWVMRTNTFLSTFVRIQKDRGQYVITTGPYQYVRHPLYAGLFVFFPAVALLLGSWWAFIPCGLNMILGIVRTSLEDRMLQAELEGYAEYAQRVRYRLIPGVW